MKKIAICLGLILSLTALSQGTLQRSTITTSSLFRSLATNETSVQFLTMLQAQLGITNITVTITVNGITNAIPTNTTTVTVSGNTAVIGTNYEAYSGNLGLWSDLSTNVLTGKVDNSTYNAAWGAIGTNVVVKTNDTRAISLPNATVGNATTSVTSGTATNVVGLLQTNSVTTNNPINGSFVIWRTGSPSYIASSNITFDGATLTLGNIGSLAGASLTTNGNLSLSGWVSVIGIMSNKSTVNIPTNTAPVWPTLNPLTLGSIYTTPPQRGWVGVSCIATNSASGWLTNISSHEARLLGGATAGNIGTNYANASLRTSPSDQVEVINVVGVLNLVNSSFDGD